MSSTCESNLLTVKTAENFPFDPALPQLAILSNPERMLEVFRTHLRPLKQALSINSCHVSWIRFVRGTRCTVQYTLRLKEKGAGCERDQWLTGTIYAGDQAASLSRKLRALNPQQDNPTAFQTYEPVSFFPPLKMLVQVFPYDRRLPALPLLMTSPPLNLEDHPSPMESEDHWNRGVPDNHHQCIINPIRYRTGARAVLRYQTQTGDHSTKDEKSKIFYVKVYRGEEGAQTFDVLQQLWKRIPRNVDDFTVGQPIAYLRRLHALIQDETPGRGLGEILIQDRDALSAARAIAKALSIFNQGFVAATRSHSQADELAELRWAQKILDWARPDLEGQINAVVETVASGLEGHSTGPTHRDLVPDHVFWDGDRVAFLDLDFLAEADPVLDPATLLAHLVGMSFRSLLPYDRVEQVARNFTEEYFARVPVAWRKRLPYHYAGALLKVAVGCFRRQELHWHETIAGLVNEASDSLILRKL